MSHDLLTLLKRIVWTCSSISSRLKKKKSEENEQNWEGGNRREKVRR
jgi:hypothetical protein